MNIFGMDWRARLLLVLGAGLLLLGVYLVDPFTRLLLALLGLAVIIAGALLDRHLKSRASKQ